MAIKNINEIQSSDYSIRDSSFLYAALANSGQRFGESGTSVQNTSFSLFDVFPQITPGCSYVQCTVQVPVSTTELIPGLSDIWHEAISREGEPTMHRNIAYINVNNIYKNKEGKWSETKLCDNIYNIDSTAIQFSQQTPNSSVGLEANYVYNCQGESLFTLYNKQIQKGQSHVLADFILNKTDEDSPGLFSWLWNKLNEEHREEELNTLKDSRSKLIVPSVLYNIITTEPDSTDPEVIYKYELIYKDNVYKYNVYKSNATFTGKLPEIDKHSFVNNLYLNYISQFNSKNAPHDKSVLYNIINDNITFGKDPITKISIDWDAYRLKFEQTDPVLIEPDVQFDSFQHDLEQMIQAYSAYWTSDTKLRMLSGFLFRLFDDYWHEKSLVEVLKSAVDNGRVQEQDYIRLDVYFNPNYSFYIYNSNKDTEYIYGTSDDITVECCVASDIAGTIEQHILPEIGKQVVVANWSGAKKATAPDWSVYDRYVQYAININYTDGDNWLLDLTSPINILKTHTLPYINEDNYWCINGFPTEIKARGLDANQPSVIIIKSSYNKSDDKLVGQCATTLHKEDIDNLGYVSKAVTVNKYTISGNENPHTFLCAIPDVNSIGDQGPDMESFLKSALIMCICDLSCEIGEDNNNNKLYNKFNSSDGFVTTFWVYTENEEGEGDFQCITYQDEQQAEYALDFNSLTNLNKLISLSVNSIKEDPDSYAHQQLVFASIDRILKQENIQPGDTGSSQKYLSGLFPVLKNYNASSFTQFNKATATGVETNQHGFIKISDEYDNNANFLLGFFDQLETDNYERIVDNSMKLSDNFRSGILFQSDGMIGVSQLYKRTNDDTRFRTINDFIPNTGKKEVIIDKSTNKKAIELHNPPIFDLSSVLINHNNTLNRINILSPGVPEHAAQGRTGLSAVFYNSYVGTSWDSTTNKSHFILGTSNENVNLNRHVLSEYDLLKFKKQTDIDINFDTLNINTKSTNYNTIFNIYNKPVWTFIPQAMSYYTIVNPVFQTDIYAADLISTEDTKLNTTPYCNVNGNVSYILKRKYKLNVLKYLNLLYNNNPNIADGNEVNIQKDELVQLGDSGYIELCSDPIESIWSKQNGYTKFTQTNPLMIYASIKTDQKLGSEQSKVVLTVQRAVVLPDGNFVI